jgi:Flp pilus assembly protein TadG
MKQSISTHLARTTARRKRQQGQSMIEAAFVVTVVVAVLFIGFHFVPVFLHLEAVVDAARQGARAAAEQGSLDQGCAAGISYSKQKLTDAGILTGAHIEITTSPAGAVPAYRSGNTITVSVQATIPLIFGGTTQFQSSASEEIQPGRSHWPVPPGVPLNKLCAFSG